MLNSRKLSVALLGAMAGCVGPITEFDPDVVSGSWRSASGVGEQEHALEVDFDLSGTATLYLEVNGSLRVVDFDVDVLTVELGHQYRFELVPEHVAGDIELQMDCVIVTPEQMRCTGDGILSVFRDLEFHRVEV